MKRVFFGLFIPALLIGCGGSGSGNAPSATSQTGAKAGSARALVQSPSNAVPPALTTTDYSELGPPNDWTDLAFVPLSGYDYSIDKSYKEKFVVYPSPFGTTVYQNPPTLTWPALGGGDFSLHYTYDIEVVDARGRTWTKTTDQTYLSDWPRDLTAGQSYSWRVRARGPGETAWDSNLWGSNSWQNWSAWRVFVISPDAHRPDEVDLEALYNTAASKTQTQRPRTFPKDQELATLKTKYGIGAGYPYLWEWNDVLARVNAHVDTADTALQSDNQAGSVYDAEMGLAIETAFVCRIVGNQAYSTNPTIFYRNGYCDKAVSRAVRLATLTAPGLRTCSNSDTGNRCRHVALTLAILYDWMYHELSSAQRTTIKNSIRATIVAENGNPGFATFLPLPKTIPMSSQGGDVYSRATAIGALMAGEDAAFKTLFMTHAGMFIAKGHVFGGEDGSFANSLFYGSLEIENIMKAAYFLNRATDYDISKLAYFNALPYFWLYFQPPVSATNRLPAAAAFGDGAEKRAMSENMLISVHAFASHLFGSNPQYAPSIRWYANRLKETYSTTKRPAFWLWMLNPATENATADVLAPTIRNSAYFPAIGMAAMHSSLSDLNRFSVYFKSSPYGSVSHSHADQNSFVVHVGGVPLFIDSGYYDSYDTDNPAHYNQIWYRQTKAHNAITHSGGVGQRPLSRLAAGRIVKYYDDTVRNNLVEVVGEATAAYQAVDPTITRMKRSMIYLRNTDTLVIYDKVAATTPRTWEWNFHTASQPVARPNGYEYQVNIAGTSACIRIASLKQGTFTSTPAPLPAGKGSEFQQWHNRYVTGATAENEFVTIIRKSCSSTTAATVTWYDDMNLWTIRQPSTRAINAWYGMFDYER